MLSKMNNFVSTMKSFSNLFRKLTVFNFLFFISCVNGQNLQYNWHEITSVNADLAESRQDGPGGDSIGGFIGGALPNPPPQNVPVGPGLGPDLGPNFVPFGLNHIILIILPQFKTKHPKLPKWLSSSIKISMPITVFFDQLKVPPGMFIPVGGIGAGGFSLPLGIPPPLRAPGLSLPPPPIPTITPVAHLNAGASPVTNAGYAAYYPQHSILYDNVNTYEEPEDSEEESEGYDSYYSEEGRKRRWKRHIPTNQTAFSSYTINPVADSHKRYMFNIRKKRATVFNTTVYKAERTTLFPNIEELLSDAGMQGKECLLRTICEVHEAPLNHYGLMGELLTMFFSVSRSVFAESHLLEYLQAEAAGKSGDCNQYFKNCKNTLFSWQEIRTKKKKKTYIGKG